MSLTLLLWLSLMALLISFLIAVSFKKKINFIRGSGTILVSLSCLILIFLSAGVLGDSGHSVELEIKAGSFHIPILIDGLSGLFLLLLSVLTICAVVFSAGFYKKEEPENTWQFYLAFPLFISGLIGLMTVDDLSLGFTIAWQLMAISSYLLIRWGRPVRFSSRPALIYLAFMESAWLMIIGATFFIKDYEFGISLAQIGEKIAQSSQTQVIIFFSLILVGFGLKAGVFPLGQLWIPGAYSTASPPVSSLLAGILEKTGIFGLVRVFFFVARGAGAQFNPALWGNILVLVGTLTLFIGTVQSIKQSNYLKLLAFSSIGQVGYIIFALGSSLVAWSSDSPAVQLLAGVIFLGAILHSLNHGVFKSLLFLVGGSLLYATNTRDLNRLGGLLAVMPVTGILAAIASYSISGMPASNGFVSKWLMISGNFLAGSNNLLLTLAGIVALFTAAFTLACYVKFFGLAFTSAGANWRLKKEIKEVPRQMLAPKIFLAAVCLSQAFIPGAYVNLIGRSINNSKGFLFPWAGIGVLQSNGFSLKILGDQTFLAATGPLIIFFIIVALVILSRWLRQSAGTREVAVPTWLCGYQDLSSDNVYTDSNMFSDLKKFFWWTGRAPDKVVDEEADEDSSDKSGGGTQL